MRLSAGARRAPQVFYRRDETADYPDARARYPCEPRETVDARGGAAVAEVAMPMLRMEGEMVS
jgi:hypothetical protein